MRIWRNLLFLIGCVIGSREEHLCFGSCLDGLQMCVRCCQPFVSEAASGVSDVDPNGHVVRLRFVVIYGLVFLSVLWYLRLTIVC